MFEKQTVAIGNLKMDEPWYFAETEKYVLVFQENNINHTSRVCR